MNLSGESKARQSENLLIAKFERIILILIITSRVSSFITLLSGDLVL